MRWQMPVVSSLGILFSSLASAAPPAQARKPVEATPSVASFQFEAGIGGGSSGWAARLAAELDYWFTPNLGVGGLLAYTGQYVFSTTSVAIVGPTLAWRDQLDKSSFFGSAALGYAEGTVTDRSLIPISYSLSGAPPAPREPIRSSVRGFAASANAGLAWPVGDAQMGTALAVDWIPSSVEAGFAATLSIMLGTPLN